VYNGGFARVGDFHHEPSQQPLQNPSPVEHRLVAREYLVPFVLVTALFFLWGIPNNLNDVLIKQFMKSFEISRFKAGLLQSLLHGVFSSCPCRPR